MRQTTYRLSVLKVMGLPKKPSIEAERFGQMVQDEQVLHSSTARS